MENSQLLELFCFEADFYGLGTYDGEAGFEGILKSKMQDEYNERVRTCDLKNSQLQNTGWNA